MANMYINDMSEVWTSIGTSYSAIKMNVTNAASMTTPVISKLLDLQVGGSAKFTVDKEGGVVATDTVTAAGFVSATAPIPFINDGAGLGSAAAAWSDLYLAMGGVINWNNADVTITHAPETLLFAGAGNGYSFDGAVQPTIGDAAGLGTATNQWSDLFLASGGVIDWAAGDITATHSANALTVDGGDLRVTAPGATATSVVTVGGGQSLTSVTTSGSVSASGNVTATGTITSGSTVQGSTVVATGSVFQGSASQAILQPLTNLGNVYLRAKPNAGGYDAYQGSDGGFRSNFFHALAGSPTATYSFYSAGAVGAGVATLFMYGNGSANAPAGRFITYAATPTPSQVYLGFHQPSVNYWAIYSSGPIRSSVNWTISDSRVKSGIDDCNCHEAHSKVMAIGVKNYRKDDGGGYKRKGIAFDETGFIAQEVEKIIPEAVMDIPVPKDDENGHGITPTESLKATNDRTLLATLWAAFQHQAEMIASLEAKVTALEARGA